jgi:hypothetical protein
MKAAWKETRRERQSDNPEQPDRRKRAQNALRYAETQRRVQRTSLLRSKQRIGAPENSGFHLRPSERRALAAVLGFRVGTCSVTESGAMHGAWGRDSVDLDRFAIASTTRFGTAAPNQGMREGPHWIPTDLIEPLRSLATSMCPNGTQMRGWALTYSRPSSVQKAAETVASAVVRRLHMPHRP